MTADLGPIETADGIARAVRNAIHVNVPGAHCVIHVDPATTRPLAAPA